MSTNVEKFLDAYNKESHDSQIELIFVLFTGSQLEERKIAKTLLDKIVQKSNVKNIIKTIETEGKCFCSRIIFF